MKRRLLPLTIAIAAAAALAVPAAGDGPPPGVSQDGYGITSPDGKLRYLALNTSRATIVEELNTRNGSLVTDTVLHGQLAVPAIGWKADGLSADGKTIVLTTYPWSHESRFVVLRTPWLDHKHVVRLKGSWSYDAISPHGRTLYLIQSLASDGAERYLVRAYDVRRRRLAPEVIADRREGEGPMTGSALTRATTRDGSWAYTLYVRPNNTGFVHALDTVHRRAVCIDLPWKNMSGWGYDARLWLSPDGTRLHLRQFAAGAPGGRSASIDTRTWRVKVSSPV
jgi:hypothetical protein